MIHKHMHQYGKRYDVYSQIIKITAMQCLNLCINIGIAMWFSYICAVMLQGEKVSFSLDYLICLPILFFIKWLSHYFSTKWTHKMSAPLKLGLRESLFLKLFSHSPQQIRELEIVKLSQLSVEGIESIEVYFSRYLPQFFYSLLAPFILFLTLSFFHWKIALLLLIGVFLIPISIVLAVKISKKVFHYYWNTYLNVGKRFVEGVQGLYVLKGYRQDETYQQCLESESESFRVITMKVLRMQLQSITIMDLISYGGTGLGILLAVLAYRNDELSFFGFVLFALLTVEFFVPLRLLGSYFHVAMNGTSAAERLEKMLATRGATMKKKAHINGNIHLQNVTVCYGKKQALKNITLQIKQGSFIGIVGESGSGKTTLGMLLQDFLKVDSGGIFVKKGIEGMPLIASVYSESHLFMGTIYSNLEMAKKNLSHEEAREVLAFVGLGNFSLTHPIMSEGVNLSSGQRQKLAIARILLMNPDVFIFDEATANVDNKSEKEIIEMMKKLKQLGKTVILITHTLDNVIDVDTIIVLHQGEIREQGNHHSLMLKQGFYKKMYHKQEV